MIYLIFIGIITLFYYNTIGWLIESWSNNQYYSHGFIVPIVSAYIILGMRKELSNIERKQSQDRTSIIYCWHYNICYSRYIDNTFLIRIIFNNNDLWNSIIFIWMGIYKEE